MRRCMGILLAAALPVAVARPAHGQFDASVRGAGLAGAYLGLARGHEALDWNPANLGLPDGPAWSVGLPRLNFAGTMLGPSLLDMTDVWGQGENIADQDREDLLAQIPETGMEMRGDVHIPWASLSVGPVAVGVSSTALVGSSIGKELVDLVLYARQYGDVDHDRIGEYRVGNTAFRDAVYTTVSAAYGHTLPLLLPFPVSVGVTARYVLGHRLERGRIFEPRVDLDGQEIYLTALGIRSDVGTGYGVDIGAAAQPFPGLTIGLAIENVWQRMTWDDGLVLSGDEFAGSEIGEVGLQDFEERLEPRSFDPTAAPIAAYEVVDNLFTEAFFPRVVRVGAAYQHGGTALGATLSTTQGEGDLYTGWPQYLAVGLEQRLPLLSFWTIRGGYASSLDGASAVSLGTSWQLGPIRLSAAASRATGSNAAAGPGFNPLHYGERFAAGTGYAGSLGLEVIGF
ncbi:MAG TPA: hypothetical protein VF188_09950 [Longimicrobiales bacterium]